MGTPYTVVGSGGLVLGGAAVVTQVNNPNANYRRDDLALADVAARLLATGLFAEVVVGANPRERPIAAGAGEQSAWIKRASWQEEDRVDPYDPIRTLNFGLWLSARDDDPAVAFARVAQLEAVAQDAIEGQGIGGFCLFAFSKLMSGVEDPCPAPEYRVRCAGQLRYRPTPAGYGLRHEVEPIVL